MSELPNASKDTMAGMICGSGYIGIIHQLQDEMNKMERELDRNRAEIDRLKEDLANAKDELKHRRDALVDAQNIYNDAVSAGKVSVDVKTSTDNNKRSKWKAYVPGLGAPAVNKRYLVKLINDWITIATYYLRVGGGYWKDDRGQELADGVVSLWKGLEE